MGFLKAFYPLSDPTNRRGSMNWTPPRFRLDRTVQATAYYLNLAGGVWDKFRLMKFLYMLDRESLRQRGYAVTYDNYFSMANGPILSNTLDLINGKKREREWDSYFVTHGNGVSLSGEPPYFGRLSRSDREIMDGLFGKFGSWSFQELKDYTHEFPEYTEVKKGRVPINLGDILKAVDYCPEDIEIILEDIRCTGYRERLLGL